MRVRLIIRDSEYLKAMIEALGKADKDIYIEIGTIGTIRNMDDRTIILTDYPEQAYDRREIKDFAKRVVFLTHNISDRLDADNNKKCQHLFKYKSMSSILADIQQISYMWNGETDSTYGLVSRIYAICSDISDKTAELSLALARQVLFRRGGSILVISMKYINEYASLGETDNSRFSRLLYYMDIKKDYPADAFTYNDSYGISYLRISQGLKQNSPYTKGRHRGSCDQKCYSTGYTSIR